MIATGQDADASWRRVFASAVLRGLDEPSRARLRAAAAMRHIPSGTQLYGAGEDADAVFVVARGRVSLQAIRRGETAPRVIREVAAGESCGAEALLTLERRATATALEPSDVVEIPAALLRRAADRSGGSEIAERERRFVERAVTADVLATMALSKDLDRVDFEMMLDAVRLRWFDRGRRLYGAGERADHACFVVQGLVQIQRTGLEGKTDVLAYLQPGDTVGHEAALAGGTFDETAVALGRCAVLEAPSDVLRSVVDRNPRALEAAVRVASDRAQIQQQVVGAAAVRSTQHAFVDLYRMHMARSLLVIDQDTCVRCGHCAWSCAVTHDGVARLVRRGDKVVTALGTPGAAATPTGAARSLLVPNSCQHCKNPACMIDCPTGAIGRERGGEVFIREDLCTGCTACAKACPWDNIAMAPRSKKKSTLSETVAVKCDLCRGYEAPACVEACPTGSLLRLDPHRDVADVSALLGAAPGSDPTATRQIEEGSRAGAGRLGLAVGCALLLGLGVGGVGLQASGVWVPGAGQGLVAGWVAAAAASASLAYAAPKRLWARLRRKRARGLRADDERNGRLPRSRMRPLLAGHIVVGSLALAGALAHGGLRTAGLAGVLDIAFVLANALGVLGAVAYAVLPSRLARIERRGALPEDFAGRGDALVDALYKEISGRDEVVKRIVQRLLLPYMRRFGGGVALLLGGRSLAQERAKVRGGIDAALEGRGGDKLTGLDAAIQIAVDRRALGARQALTWTLRAWLVPHIVLAVLSTVLLVAHVVVMTGWP